MTHLCKNSMESAFEQYMETVFELQEVISAGVRNINMIRENIGDAGKPVESDFSAHEQGYTPYNCWK